MNIFHHITLHYYSGLPKMISSALLKNSYLSKWELIPKSQCGYGKDRVTIGMIFTAKQIQEKCKEQNVVIYIHDVC